VTGNPVDLNLVNARASPNGLQPEKGRPMLRTAILLLGLFGGLASVLAGQPGGESLPPNVVAQLRKVYARFDADADGDLSRTERDALVHFVADAKGFRLADRVAAFLEKADADADGTITAKEWSAFTGTPEQPSVSKSTVMLRMSDGTKLATDLYLPDGQGPFPVVLARTPYGKNRQGGMGRDVTGLGLVFAVQDHRGRFASEGENIPFIGCGWEPYRDGAETVAWLAEQPWCNGKICTVGGSAGGITQNLMAGAAPGNLTAQYIQVAAASLYHHAVYVGGALRKSQVEKWTTGNGFDPAGLQAMKAHPAYDDYWRTFDSTRKHAVMNVPAVHFGGWFDTFAQGTTDSFVGRQHEGAEGARGRQKLVMGPWSHGGWRRDGVGELRFPDAKTPPAYDAMRWIEYHLLGADNGIMDEPAVAYYVMGDASDPEAPGNEWRFAEDWPLPAEPTSYFFRAAGALSTETSSEESARTYTFDPDDPCPTIGGCNLVLPKGPRDQTPIESRDDVLTFTTTALEEPIEVTGRVRARIRLSSSAVDTDLSVRLCDVYPDGRSYLMAEGMRRARFRDSFEEPALLEPDTWTEIEVDCWSTSLVFNKGHRIRVTVTSSNFPRFDVNPGTGKPWAEGCERVKQTNRIGCGGERGSRIVLPVIKGE